jgi:2,4-dienoyl-CoA reductase-like NADH-dependent reductase (Old Yellow Enzyme family)
MDVSSGAFLTKKILWDLISSSFADQIKSATGILTGVGLITEAKQAEEIVASGKADMVLFARESLRDLICFNFAHDLEAINWPKQ